jgi:crossover junction endodeoxyribonuclease RuvC
VTARGRVATLRAPSPPPSRSEARPLRLRILGIDPGSLVTGYGVVERRGAGIHHVAHGTLRPPRAAALASRLAALQAGLARVIEAHRPDLVVVEQVFVAANARAALVLGHARGVALAAASAGGLLVEELSPQQVKQAVVGHGGAEKLQVQRMVQRLLGLAAPPPEDAADALAAALCRAHQSVLPALASLPLGAQRRGRAKPRAPRFVLRRAR